MPDPTTHQPITREPRRVRPPYDVPDRQFDHLTTSDPGAWRRALLLDRIAALAEPLAGLQLTPLEHRIVEFLADGEVHVVGVLANLLWRAREASPAIPGSPVCPRCGVDEVAGAGLQVNSAVLVSWPTSLRRCHATFARQFPRIRTTGVGAFPGLGPYASDLPRARSTCLAELDRLHRYTTLDFIAQQVVPAHVTAAASTLRQHELETVSAAVS